ncbi:T9SS type A sorting domain-containing protein [Carboxylicivirga mesophila]|uniref:T9SS type A sorting domain-containing protein n=1 Tax=Carboxylicivirga mesophila TaxID=1166478 RepID=A0ABS5KA46_9BACT|nr:T9SS type A sorting domain-containing protein [Carboxylicivirga mesophila]MBS2211396.1 T9SS type A sorting domain-containing protein [Carboxylicivirga mesophila]
MKTTTNKIWAVAIITVLFLVNAGAQTNWDVTVTNFSFTPASLTIDQGDVVTWNNTLGTHNVNGTTATFSNNPASFGNSLQNAPWQYSFTFDIAGEYSYQCDQHPGSMQGTITVNTATSITGDNDKDGIKIYPSPVREYLFIEFNDNRATTYSSIQIFDLTGQMVFSQPIGSNDKLTINMGHLPPSLYFYRLQNTNGSNDTGKVLKK